MSLRLLRPLAIARIGFQKFRTIATTSPRLYASKGVHADSHTRVEVTSGQAFADGAKEEEATRSGLPWSQEPHEGESTQLGSSPKPDLQLHLLVFPCHNYSASRIEHT
jgi:hypothetical protein